MKQTCCVKAVHDVLIIRKLSSELGISGVERRLEQRNLNPTAMLFSYLVLAFRLLSRNPFVTLINVIGLAIGFATFYILWPYTESELNTDSFHKDAGQIVRLSRVYQPSAGDPKSRVELPMHNCVIAKEFASTYPEITELTRIIPQEEFLTFRQGFGKDL